MDESLSIGSVDTEGSFEFKLKVEIAGVSISVVAVTNGSSFGGSVNVTGDLSERFDGIDDV